MLHVRRMNHLYLYSQICLPSCLAAQTDPSPSGNKKPTKAHQSSIIDHQSHSTTKTTITTPTRLIPDTTPYPHQSPSNDLITAPVNHQHSLLFPSHDRNHPMSLAYSNPSKVSGDFPTTAKYEEFECVKCVRARHVWCVCAW